MLICFSKPNYVLKLLGGIIVDDDDAEDFEIQSKRKKPNNIDGLLDELLVEILCRLPSHKTVVMCKSVCKQWHALVSQPFFICRFISYKVGKNNTSYYAITNGFSEHDELRMKIMNDRAFGFVVRTLRGNHQKGPVNDNTWKGFMIRFNDPIYNPKNLTVSSLSRLSNKLPHTLTVVGACNDLLLYERYGNFSTEKLELYISNVQTGQWFALPSLHPIKSADFIGLIGDPYHSTHTGNVTLNDAYHTCIFVIPWARNVSEIPAYLFSSDTGGVWRNVVLSLPLTCRTLLFCNHFCIGRKFYFHCSNCVIGIDPFVIDNDVINCHSLELPPGLYRPIAIFGVFHERLYTCDGRCDNGECRVWVLEDYETGQWSLRHSIMGQDWTRRDLSLEQDSCFGKPISFHPTNPDIVYMLFDRWIVMCKLSTREMEVASTLREYYKEFSDGCSFQITLPTWPTPLPFLAN